MRFKKIASVLASAAMLFSTVGFAAAANYPQPFVSASGVPDVAIVYGSHPAVADATAVANIQNHLNSKVVAGAVSGAIPQGGDFVKLERTGDFFNLGESANRFWSTIDYEQLSTVLAKGEYENGQGKKFNYEQTIKLGELTLKHFTNVDFNNGQPIIGFDLARDDHIFNYTLEFTPNAAEGGTNFADLEGTDIVLMGRPFYISSVEYTSSGVKMTLLDSATEGTVRSGEISRVVLDGKTYEVAISVPGASTVRLNVNGVDLPAMREGQTRKLSDGTHIGIKEYFVAQRESDSHYVVFTLGSGEIVLENNKEVEVNGEKISSLKDKHGYRSTVKSYITNSSTNIEDITLEWNLYDDAWIAPGYELEMPGFNTVSLKMGGFTFPKTEKTRFSDSSRSLRVTTPIKDGEISLSLLYANSTNGFAGLGRNSGERLRTNSSTSPTLNLDATKRDYFVATWISGTNGESYAFKFVGVDDENGKNKTTLQNIAGGNDIIFSEVGKDRNVGGLKLTLVAASYTGRTASIKIEPASSGTAHADRVVTKEGMVFMLPVHTSVNGTTYNLLPYDNQIHLGNSTDIVNPTSWNMMFFEEDRDGSLLQAARNFTVSFNIDSDRGTQPNTVTLPGTEGIHYSWEETEIGSREYEGHKFTELATKLAFYNPSGNLNTLDVIYHGSESYGNVFLAETGITFSEGGAIGKPLLDTEVAGVNKNLIVVGGSCVNTLAAELLGRNERFCGDEWTAATGIGANTFLIQTFARSGGKVATLVAGWSAIDTANAATALTTQTVDTTPGKKYKGSTATSIEPVLA